ncbi:MAG: hypothetical protein HKN16_03000, partial [Saprospiraceae bacterium]|nr:hypothetical protein [Saprospiraceae bacterium]
MISGFKAYFEAIGLVSKLRLWKYFLLPGILSIIFAFVVIGLAFGVFAWIGPTIIGFVPSGGEGWFSEWLNSSLPFLEKASSVLAGILVI